MVGLDAIALGDVEAMQRHLTRIGLYKDKLDGKAGMQTRAALGAYQKSAGPQGRLLAERSGAALHERGALMTS
jgi:peptidoglycan hydrolase-like protein with peptidoglycan-binding domain